MLFIYYIDSKEANGINKVVKKLMLCAVDRADQILMIPLAGFFFSNPLLIPSICIKPLANNRSNSMRPIKEIYYFFSNIEMQTLENCYHLNYLYTIIFLKISKDQQPQSSPETVLPGWLIG